MSETSTDRPLGTLIAQLPRVRLANLPTPLEEMARLSAFLGGPRIWIKRDDSTGLALGGSKVRALEFTLADAINKGADTVVTMGEIQSNHARLTAAAARKLGLSVVLIIVGEAKRRRYEGNLLLCDILGADITFATWPEHNKVLDQTVKELRDGGHIPYILPFGGSSLIGTVAYINEAIELQRQAADMGFEIDHVIHATASGGLQTGLSLGNRMLGTRAKVIGVASAVNSSKIVMEKYLRVGRDVRRMYNSDLRCEVTDLSVVDHLWGETSDTATVEKRIMNAIMLVAQTEGIVLDPEYTGKSMAVLIDMIKQGRFHKENNVVFIHTGGTPALFAQPGASPSWISSGVIRLYRKHGRRCGIVKWLRTIPPVRG